MKPGDIVEKFSGDWDLGKIGCLIRIDSNPTGTDLAIVLVDGVIKPWYAKFVRKYNEIN